MSVQSSSILRTRPRLARAARVSALAAVVVGVGLGALLVAVSLGLLGVGLAGAMLDERWLLLLALGVLLCADVVAAGTIVTIFVRVFREVKRRLRGLCLHCGYDLRGNVSGICPECGATVNQPTFDIEP